MTEIDCVVAGDVNHVKLLFFFIGTGPKSKMSTCVAIATIAASATSGFLCSLVESSAEPRELKISKLQFTVRCNRNCFMFDSDYYGLTPGEIKLVECAR